jgi:eukaryotic-like serine/threonine-protein kinase
MRCLNCRRDGILLNAQMCPQCGVHLPSLMRDLLPPGTLLRGGEYRIDYALGQGGFGITYRAADLNLERPVAIKEFYPQDYVYRDNSNGQVTMPTSDAETYARWLGRFEREGKILARLNHPGVVRVYSLFKENETAYLVMELLAGKTLKDELDVTPGQPLAEARVVEIMAALVDALDTVHGEGVYHLDLKPDNVMVTVEGRVVLVDFGAARQDMSSLTSRRSRKSTTAYTPEYAPLELLNGEATSTASDVFELGMILHEMLTGQRPAAAWDRLLRGDTWCPSELMEPWQGMVTGALRLRAEERPQNVREWWQIYLSWIDCQEQDETSRVQAQLKKALQEGKPRIQQEVEIKAQQEAKQHHQVDEEQARQESEWLGNGTLASSAKPMGLSRRTLLLGGLGSVGLGSAWLLSQLAQQSNLPTFSFETVTVDEQGQIINRQSKTAHYFTENLGNGVLLEMIEIPAGEFLMGSPDNEFNRESDEGPQRRVRVPRFFMGRFTVTQIEWQQLMGSDPSSFKGNNHPVNNISWYDAQEFCKRLSQQSGRAYRLPSEAEWEYACRADSISPFHFGPTITPELVNYDGNYSYGSAAKGEYRKETTPVGSFPANGFGLHDMHGNIWEWCEDVYHKSYQGAPTNSSAWVSGADTSFRLVRGGSGNSYAKSCRSADREGWNIDGRSPFSGFRLALSFLQGSNSPITFAAL